MSQQRGTVTKRGSSWSYKFSYTDANGVRVGRRRQGFANKAEAQRALTAALADIDAGRGTASSRVTVEAYLLKWIETYSRSQSRKISTTSTTRFHVTSYIIPRIGSQQLSKVTPQVIANLYADLLANGHTRPLSPKTVRNVAGTLHKAFSDAVKRGHIPRNPADGVDLPRWERPEMHPYDELEVSRFLEHSARHGDPLTALWRVMFATGIRRGEMLGLRWVDVDLVSGDIKITQSKVESSGVHITTPKTRAGRRTITLDTDTITALAMLRNAQDASAEMIGSASFPLVATDLDGRAIHPLTFTRRFQAIAKDAGLRVIRLHDTRHTHATMLLDHGIPIHTVSRRLGHAMPSTTLDVYAAFMPSADRLASDTIGDVMRNAGNGLEVARRSPKGLRRSPKVSEMDGTSDTDVNDENTKPISDKDFGTRTTHALEATLGIEPPPYFG
jgi:integrase